ncbi:MAG: peptidoglycan DD-metalloendopeptidase family protein [Ruminococcaceae bacterium]|nr:peptidoglycan DD-metalloendopeptidase family protein [Oscillospiraceae bacterium]
MKSIYRLPFDGKQRITSPYGYRTLNGARVWHNGFDFVGDEDKRVRAIIGGVVKSSTIISKSTGNITWQWGNYVKVLGADGNYWYYCHMASRAVKVGDTVKAGDVLGVMGNTGYSFGAHTHVEVRNAANVTLNIAIVLGITNGTQILVQAATSDGTVTVTAILNVRSAPATSYSKVATLAKGEVVQISEKHENWGYVSGKGWICLDYTS